MSPKIDPIGKFEHDHVHLTRMVDAIRDSIQGCLRGEVEPGELRDDFADFLSLLNEELYEHFDLEEEGLFPYILEHFADTKELIDSLQRGHDRMCGLASRMEHMLRNDAEAFGERFDALIALFARFDANYVKHAASERGLLRSLHERVNPAQRKALAEILEAL